VVPSVAVKSRSIAIVILAVLWSWQSLRAAPPASIATLEKVHGQCVGCGGPFQLGQFQFLDALEGWAAGFIISVSNGHVSQSSTILHTTDGGLTWRALKSVETYGVEVSPAFYFINRGHGWISWPRTDGEDRFIRTEDGGRSWRSLHPRLEGTLVHLRLFDSRFGVAALSTNGGVHFAVTTNGGAVWADQPIDLPYPEILLFLNQNVGWIGGARNGTQVFTPRLFLTTNGGKSWSEASFPEKTSGNPHDLFFVTPKHGWLVLWNQGTKGGSALLESTDGGRTWTARRISARPGAGQFLDAVRFLSEETGFVFVSDAASKESGILSPSTKNAAVLSTVDGGQTWQRLALPAAVQSCQVFRDEVWCSSGMDILKIHARH
jgi:photosystem II stability/assembly factor-like uncharacterized protein